MNRKENDLITVITISYNAVSSIEQTILSVINQTYNPIEYIIIDGGSTDGTVDIIKKYATEITFWISERDQGIYDAMNKGIRKATGKWINFMNSGDVFFDKNTISGIYKNKTYDDNINIIYGETLYKISGHLYKKKTDIRSLGVQMELGHQSTFVRTSVHKEHLFADIFCIGADFNFFHDRYKEDPKQFLHVDNIISIFDTHGMSSTKMITLYIEQCVVNGFIKNENFEKALVGIAISYYVKKTIRKILPSFIHKAYLRKKLKNSLYE